MRSPKIKAPRAFSKGGDRPYFAAPELLPRSGPVVASRQRGPRSARWRNRAIAQSPRPSPGSVGLRSHLIELAEAGACCLAAQGQGYLAAAAGMRATSGAHGH